jgi:hypothetical protein
LNPILPLWVLHVGATALPGTAGNGAPSTRAELERFSAAWSVRFSPVPPLSLPSRATQAEPARDAAERVEALFDSAQSALGALRPEEAGQSLKEAERILLAHPELPQAAWLLAEHHALSAQWLTPREPSAARALTIAAAVLEGLRVTPFREGTSADIASPGHDNGQTDLGSALTPVSLDVTGLSANDRLEWDAEARTSPLSTTVGQHQLRILRGERTVWASWISVGPSSPELRVNLPRVSPCSAEDLGETLDGARGPSAAPHVACPEWAIARVGSGELELALCRGSQCGDWHRAPIQPEPFKPPAQALTRAGFPRWAAYAVAGVGAAAVAGAVMAEAGVFGGGGATRERLRYDGLK